MSLTVVQRLRILLKKCRKIALDLRYILNFQRHDTSQWYQIKLGPISRALFPTYRDKGNRSPVPSWYRVTHPFVSEAEHIEINLDYAMQSAQVDGIALIFFMGMGDYFYSTPLIAEMKRKYPHIPILAFVSRTSSRNNSPLLGSLLSVNPHISDVKFYDGSPAKWLMRQDFPDSFKTYNYQDCIKDVPDRYLAVPVLYEHSAGVKHRQNSLFETFKISVPNPTPRPIIYLPEEPSELAERFFQSVKAAFEEYGARGVVFLQLDARSSRFEYPYTEQLAKRLLDRGFIVVTASETSIDDPRLFKIVISKFSMLDSIYILSRMKNVLENLYIISVASVFWSISSGLNIKNLGMQHFVDEAMHCYWYDNIYVISHVIYEKIRNDRIFVPENSEFCLDSSGYANFSVEYIEKCFDIMVA